MQFRAVVQEQLAEELAKIEAVITEFVSQIETLDRYTAKRKASDEVLDEVIRRLRVVAGRVLHDFCVSGDLYIATYWESLALRDNICVQMCGGLRVWFWQEIIIRPDPTHVHRIIMGGHPLDYVSRSTAQEHQSRVVLKFSTRRSDAV